MRIRLNDQSILELNKAMKALGVENPTHAVQKIITKFLKTVEDKKQ